MATRNDEPDAAVVQALKEVVRAIADYIERVGENSEAATHLRKASALMDADTGIQS